MTAPEELLLGLALAARAAGLPVTQDRAQSFTRAVAAAGLGDRDATYWAGRATLCASPDDTAAYDEVFRRWFAGGDLGVPARSRPAPPVLQAPFAETDAEGVDGKGDGAVLRATASDVEVLRHRDLATLTPAERQRVDALFRRLAPRPPHRMSRRRRPARRGGLDRDATLRRAVAHAGEPVSLAWRHRTTRPRRVVLVLDVSGSMSAYADALLRLAHRVTQGSPARTETFSVGTRMTRLTPAMRLREAEAALVAAGETVPDWSGGTRLGESLRVLLDRWGQRGPVRGAVVVICSDGWERGDAALLGEQVARLSRLAHRVVWVNPHKGGAGYQPVQRGMAAALPHVDDFVAGHSFAAFDALCRVVARA